MNVLPDEVKTRLGDPWWRLNNLYKIEDERGKLVTFTLRPAQYDMLSNMHRKNLVLKARQLGFSTAIDIWILDQALFTRHLKCGVIAQDKQAASEIFRTKIMLPFDSLHPAIRHCFSVVERRQGASGGYILFAHGSSIQVATSFRSGTVQRLHISEHGKICAKYPAKALEVRTGTLNAVGEEGIVFIESTAEGAGGDFYEMSNRAQEVTESGLPLSGHDYRFHFYAWWRDAKYRAAVPSAGLRLSQKKSDYFSMVEKTMGISLSDEQKQWYINKAVEQREEMPQEYPSTPQEAFLVSGRRVFSAESMLRAQAGCRPPYIIWDIDPLSGKKTKMQSLRGGTAGDLQRTLAGYLLVWELPDQSESYAIGADIAEGLDHGDHSSLDVVKKSTGEQVAHWYGHMDAERFAHLLAHVGRLYNRALIGPERNNHGHAVILKLRDLYPQRGIYREQHINQDNDDDTPRLGWLTTRQSKPILSEGLKSLLNHGISGIRWSGTISEMNSYVYDARGAMHGQPGCRDDQVMSYMIAQEMRARMPEKCTPKPEGKAKAKHWMTH